MAKREKVTSIKEAKKKAKKEVQKPEEAVQAAEEVVPEDELGLEVEEADGEEVYTIDQANGIIYEKPKLETEKKPEKEGVSVVETDLEEEILKVAEPVRNEIQREFESYFTAIIVEQAIGSLIRNIDSVLQEMNEVYFKSKEEKSIPFGVNLFEPASEEAKNRIQELRKAAPYSDKQITGTVYYDKIPKWAHYYIKDYMMKCTKTLTELIDN